MNRLIHILKYHNAVPIAVAFLLLGATGALAASPAVRESIVGSTTTVRSIDNSYVRNLDLAAFDPKLLITKITEDDSFFYVTYTYTDVGISDYVWRDILKEETLAVSKKVLGEHDLGVFVAKELGQIVDHEFAYLKEVQGIERVNGETKKIATTEYSGLVGKFLRPDETVFEGYQPVKEEPKMALEERPSESSSSGSAASSGDSSSVSVASASTPNPSPSREDIQRIVEETVRNLLAQNAASQSASVASAGSTSSVSGDASDTEPPVITILGNNPALIDVGASYADLGATVADNLNPNIGLKLFLDGVFVSQISLDTSAAGEHAVAYVAADQAGNIATSTRRISVRAPATTAVTTETSTVATTTTSISTDTVQTADITSTTTADTTVGGSSETASTTPTGGEASQTTLAETATTTTP